MAGFEVVGVDINKQPRYCGDAFIQGDALEVVAAIGHEFDAIHVSPECQGYSVLKNATGKEYRMQIAEVRQALQATGKPYVIENVEGARGHMIEPLMLCGSMFGLRVYRHRLFETNFFLMAIPHVPHRDKTPRSGRGKSPKGFISVTGNGGAPNLGMPYLQYARWAMGIDWMSSAELSQAIPPAYTEWIGRHLLEYLRQPLENSR